MIKPTIFILDGEQRSSLAATRSLGKKGFNIIIGSIFPSSLSGVSKYCLKQIQYPSPNLNIQAFIDRILRVITDEKVDILLPMTDISVYSVLMHEKDLRSSVKIPFVSLEKYLIASNKIEIVKMAIKMGIPVPNSLFIDDPKDVKQFRCKLNFPLVLKPTASLIQNGDHIQHCGIKIIDSFDKLRKATIDSIPFKNPFMIQEKLEGEGLGIFALFDNGKPAAIFSHRRLREKPPWGGVSVLSESTKPDTNAKKYAIRLLKKLNWHGVAMVEFKRALKSNLPLLMEINARPWGSLQLSIDAGVDFPYLLYLLSQGETIPKIAGYNFSRLRWLIGDFDSLYITLKTSKNSFKLPSSYPDKITCIVNFIREFREHSKLEVLRKDDWMPFLLEIKNYFLSIIHKT